MKASVKPVFWFIFFAFLPVWAVCAAFLIFGYTDNTLLLAAFTGFMFMPALASVLARLICREGFSGMMLRPRFRKNALPYVLSWLLPLCMTILCAAFYFLIYPDMFDTTFTALRASGISAEQIPAQLLIGFAAMLLGPLLNGIPALGEELGWRGYLQQRLSVNMSKPAAAVLTGAIWGLWHAPMIALGHNYGFGYPGYPYTGILLFIAFCICFGLFLSWLSERTRSAIPAALAHGGLNASASLGVLFCLPSYSPLIGPMPMGLVAGVPVLLLGIVCFFALRRMERAEKAAACAVEGE